MKIPKPKGKVIDLDEYRIPDEEVEERRKAAARVAKGEPWPSGNFYRIPKTWLDKAMLATKPSWGGLVVAIYLYRRWLMRREGEDSIKVANLSLSALGVSADTKSRTLPKLETAGLIRVIGRERKSPLVMVIVE